MTVWVLLILGCIWGMSEDLMAFHHSMTKDSFVGDRLLSAKVGLARSFHRTERETSNLLNVSTTDPWISEVGFNGASSFWAFSQILILADSSIHRLEESEGSLKLHSVTKLPDLTFADQLAFIEAVEWKRILFILVAFRSGYCRLYTATPSMKITQRQTIHNFGPQDAEFFTYENELFLIVISSKPENHKVPSYIYRWTGTHFDEIDTFQTNGAVAVSTFPFKGSVIITVAQYPGNNPMIGSQVFRWSPKRFEILQFLATNGPVAIQFLEAYGESYLLVINEFEYSSIFWWTGREFINWESLYDVKGMNKISIGYTEGETLILIAKHDKIQIYKLMENKMQRLTTISLFDGEEIISMSIHMDLDSRLIVISKKGGVLSTSVFHLHLVKGRIGDYKQKVDPLLQCLINLNDKLLSTFSQIKHLKFELPNLLSVKKDISVKGKIVVNGTISLKSSSVSSIEVTSSVGVLLRNPFKINDQIKISAALASKTGLSSNDLVKRSSSKYISGYMHVQQNIVLANSVMDQLSVTKLNQKTYENSNLLSYTTRQVLVGTVVLETLVTSELNITALNRVLLEDLLITGDQVVSGSYKVRTLIVNNLHMPEGYTINKIGLSMVVKKDVKRVKGHKKLYAIDVRDISVVLWNNDNITYIEDMFVHKAGEKYKVEALSFKSELTIIELHVAEINGIKWDLFKESVFIKGRNQYVNGSLQFAVKTEIDYLFASGLNNRLTRDFMTYKTDQEILSIIDVFRVNAEYINVEILNGLHINSGVAQKGKINYINGSVLMENIHVHSLITHKDASWIGISKQGEMNQAVTYSDRLIIFGNFQVEDVVFSNSKLKVNDSVFDLWSINHTYWINHQKQITNKNIHMEELKTFGDMIVQTVNGLKVKDIIHIIASNELFGIYFEELKITREFNVKYPAMLNGINLQYLNETAVTSKGDYMIKGCKKFYGNLLGINADTRWINGRDIIEMVPLNKEVLAFGRKKILQLLIKEDLHADGDATVDTLNKFPVAPILSSALRIDRSFSLQSIKLSNVIGDIIQASTINKIDFNNFVKSLKLETSTIMIKEVRIYGDVEFLGHLNIENMNGLQLYPYLYQVTNKGIGGRIYGQKEFLEDISTHLLEASEINSIDMDSLETYALSKTKPQNITSSFKLKKMSLDNFIIKEINGKNIINAVLVKDTIYTSQEIIAFSDLLVEADLRVQKINNCKIEQVNAYLNNFTKFGHFEALNITHHMNWEIPIKHENSLSNCFNKAVKKNYDHFIDGRITFLGDIYCQLVITKGDINGIDLRAISNDCVKKSSMKQEVFGQKIFLSSINASKVEVKGNAIIKAVNGIEIMQINGSLVRKTDTRKIKGYKQFLNGYEAEKLKCGGQVKGVSVSTIATTNSDILPPTEVLNLEVYEDFNYDIVNSMGLNQFILERIQCSGVEEINANMIFNGKARLAGKTKSSSINNIKLQETMTKGSQLLQEVKGMKIFKQDILLKGKIDTGLLNGLSLEKVYNSSIQANKDVEIYGNIVFLDKATMDTRIIINNLVNSFALVTAQKDAIEAHYRSEVAAQVYISKVDDQITENLKAIKGISTTLLYLEYENKFEMLGINATSADFNVFGGKVTLNIHSTGEENCDLPSDCLCSRQYEIDINEEGYKLSPLEANKRQFKAYNSVGGLGAELFTNTISQDNRCKLPPEKLTEEFNKIVWMVWNDETGNITYNLDIDTYNFEGYVSDMKSLSVGDDFYLAVAIYYDAIKSTHNTNSFILKWTPGETSVKVFQYIPTFGAKVLDLFHSKGQVYLFIGNSYDSDLRTNHVHDEIYKLNEQKTEFVLLRTIQTKGMNSVKSCVLNDESFIIISQQFGSVVIILKYNEEYNNFYFYQKLHFATSTLGVGVFYIKGSSTGDAYLGIAVMDGSFHVYKYSHIEGFKKLTSHWQKGIQSFVPFHVGKQLFILTPSVLGTRIIHAVIQGTIEY